MPFGPAPGRGVSAVMPYGSPVWSPAWDYDLHQADAQIGTTYHWDLCMAVSRYAGRARVLDEVRRYVDCLF